jgi:hypothetical protein
MPGTIITDILKAHQGAEKREKATPMGWIARNYHAVADNSTAARLIRLQWLEIKEVLTRRLAQAQRNLSAQERGAYDYATTGRGFFVQVFEEDSGRESRRLGRAKEG